MDVFPGPYFLRKINGRGIDDNYLYSLRCQMEIMSTSWHVLSKILSRKLIFKPTAIFSRVPCIADVIKGGPASFNYRTFTLIAVAIKRNR
jgi:hypothetical protein